MSKLTGVDPRAVYNDGKILTDSLGPDQKHDLLVFIGRFQPLHYGHMRVIDIALTRAKQTLILVGSANVGRTLYNTFTYQERYAMIASQYQEAIDDGRLVLRPLDDHTYADADWLEQVQDIVEHDVLKNKTAKTISLIGCEKDHTSYYLGLFPQWGNIGVEFKVPLNSTDVRKAVFLQKNSYNPGPGSGRIINEEYEFIHKACPPEIARLLYAFTMRSEYEDIKEEWGFINTYRNNRQKGNEYPVIDHTVDACVVQSGHVLVVQRRWRPGKGLFALPGGFLNEFEPVDHAILRELREETQIDVSDTVLRAGFVKREQFSDPRRSDRGRIITECGLFKLQDRAKLPTVKGADDAACAFWLPLNKVDPSAFFEDHAFIIRKLTKDL